MNYQLEISRIKKASLHFLEHTIFLKNQPKQTDTEYKSVRDAAPAQCSIMQEHVRFFQLYQRDIWQTSHFVVDACTRRHVSHLVTCVHFSKVKNQIARRLWNDFIFACENAKISNSANRADGQSALSNFTMWKVNSIHTNERRMWKIANYTYYKIINMYTKALSRVTLHLKPTQSRRIVLFVQLLCW